MFKKTLVILLVFLMVFGNMAYADDPPPAGGTGSGTIEDPYTIATPAQLNAIRGGVAGYENWGPDKHYILVADINLSGYSSGTGWEPIDDAENMFTGSFDGDGFTIENLTINASSGYKVGLFGSMAESGSINNLNIANANINGGTAGGVVGWNSGTVTNCSVNGSITGNQSTGGIIGWNSGTIENCSAGGSITASDNTGGIVGYSSGPLINCTSYSAINSTDDAGGIAGWCSGAVDNCQATGNVVSTGTNAGGLIGFCSEADVTNSSSQGNVTGNGSTGGLIGFYDGTATMENCHATGNVSGGGNTGGLIGACTSGTVRNSDASGNVTGYDRVGGLIGYGEGTVEGCFANGDVSGSSTYIGGLIGLCGAATSNSYALGNVSGNQYVGGLVGLNFGQSIADCFASGQIRATQSAYGGLIGANYGTAPVNSFYNSEISGYSDTGKGIPKTTAEIKQQLTFTGWDFTDVWIINPSVNNGYPYLQDSDPQYLDTQRLSGIGGAEKSSARDISQADSQSLDSEPVDTATGAQVLERPLLNQQGAMSFNLTLNYNSLLLNEGPLGRGWSHNYETRIEELVDGNLVLHWNANKKNTFTDNGNNQYVSADHATRNDLLTKLTDGSYNLLRKDQSQYLFAADGKVTEIQDGHGHQLNLTYDVNGRLAGVTEPVSGMALTFTYNAGDLLESVTDSLARQAGFSYDGSHNLTVLSDPAGNSMTYTYNSEGRVLTATDADSIQIFQNEYDNSGRIAAQDDAVSGNLVTQFHYTETTDPDTITTTVTDRIGNQRILTHDTKYQLIQVIDKLNNVTAYTYDEDGNRLSETNAKQLTTEYTYDARGNLLTVTDPAENVTTMTYDSRNNLLTMTNAAGKTITYTYDNDNNPLTITDALNNTAAYTYQNGLVQTKTTPRQGITTYTYQNGLLQSTINEEGYALAYTYDDAGRVSAVTDGAGKTTSFTYDNNDNLLTQTDPLGHTVSYTYDCRGNTLTATDAEDNTTTYAYNGNSKLLSVTDALDNETTYTYDGEDRLISTTDARNNTVTQTLDAKGRTIGITDALLNTTSMEYDQLDNLLNSKDAYNQTILTLTYDNLNNPLTETDALGHTTSKEYDNLNRLTSLTDPLERVTQYAYDDLDRLLAVTDPLLGISSQGFDADGNRTTLADPNSNQLTYTYDQMGRVTARTSTANKTITYQYDNLRDLLTTLTNGRGQSITYQYDDAGRLVSSTGPDGTTAFTYDDNGNILSKTDSAGTVTFVYDELNRVTEYTDVYGNVIQYAYDEAGNLATLTYPGNKTVQYAYDANNRLTQVTDWANRTTVYTYDNNGRLATTTRDDGSVETRTYDAAGRLTQIEDVKAAQTVINQFDFTLDEVNNITEETGGLIEGEDLNLAPSAAMTYGADNRLATYEEQPIVYDDDGNMTGGPLNGIMAAYQYDSYNRLVAAGDTSYTYDANHNRVEVDNNGSITRYVVNPSAALSQILMETDENGLVKSYYIYGLGLVGKEDAVAEAYSNYHFDSRGSTVALTDENGEITDRYNYGPYGEIIQQTGTTENAFRYVGQYGVVSDANGLYHMRARYYNPEIKCFINEDDLVRSIEDGLSLNRYAYAQGNPVIYVDPSGNVTLSIGFNLSGAAIGMTSLTGVVSFDDKGNIAFQVTTSKGLSVGTPSSSFTGIFMGTNAPTVKELNGPSYQTGGSIAEPIGLIPAAMGAEGVIIPDQKTGKTYYGFDFFLGLGTPGTEAHLEQAYTKTVKQVNVIDIWNNFWNSNNSKTDIRYTNK